MITDEEPQMIADGTNEVGIKRLIYTSSVIICCESVMICANAMLPTKFCPAT